MGARFNLILASDSADSDWWTTVVSRLAPLATRRIGTMRAVMVYDHTTGQVQELPLAGKLVTIPLISPREIATLYAEDVTAGCILLAREGRFQTVTVSVQPADDADRLLNEIWSTTGDVVDVLLSGEELEVDEADLQDVLSHGRIPEHLDLCEEAIVRPRLPGEYALNGGKVAHGGILIFSHRRADGRGSANSRGWKEIGHLALPGDADNGMRPDAHEWSRKVKSMQSIRIQIVDRSVGEWEFDEDPELIRASRTAEGFCITLPSRIRLRLPQRRPRAMGAMVSNLEAVVYAADGSELEIGVARDSHWYRTYGDEPLQEAQLNWRGSLATLQKIEHLRNGGPVRLMLRCCGRGHFLYGEYDGHEKRPLMSEPDPFSGQVIVTYPKEIWVAMTRRLGATANVLVEVPLSPPPPAPWDEVWAAVAEARDLLERGGDTNWVASVKAVRVALEKWQAIEKEKMGPGWKAPTPAERKERTKTERLDNVRWHLLQCAHQGAHGLADGWTRDDAVLMLSTLCALLAIRKP